LSEITNPAIYLPILFMTLSGIIFYVLWLKPGNKIARLLLLFILLIDLFFYGHFLHKHSINVDSTIKKDSVVEYLKKVEDNPNSYRIFPVLARLSEIRNADFICSNLNILLPVSTISGYTPLYPKNSLKLLNARRNGTFKKPIELAAHNKILSILNTKYLIAPPQYQSQIKSLYEKVATIKPDHGRLISNNSKAEKNNGKQVPFYKNIFTSPSGTAIYQNLNVLPRAYMVGKVQPVKTFDEAYQVLTNADSPFDPRQEALVELPEEKLSAKFTPGNAKILSYKSQKVIIKTQSVNQSFLVLSDRYYPGWKAYIDGKKTKIYRTNGIVRGIIVPAGSHVVKFVYLPKSFIIGLLLSITSVIIFIITFLIIRKKQKLKT